MCIRDRAGHEVVIESIIENVDEKKSVYKKLETVLSPTAIIGSNTSAIPVTVLQSGLQHPERVLGIHWAEPAHITRFMAVSYTHLDRYRHCHVRCSADRKSIT